jgi:hypothetical protein
MAFIPLVPVTLNITSNPPYGQAYVSPVVAGPTGTPIDLSAWVSLTAHIVPAAPSPAGASATFGTVTATNAGIITLETSSTDLASTASGTARLQITGKATSGDTTLQLLATGVISVQNPAA